MVDQVVLTALREAVHRGGAIRLVTSGKRPENEGLFPKRAKPYAAAIALCLDKEHGLLDIAREERKGKTVSLFVTINERGLDVLAAHLPVEEYGKLLEEAAPPFRAKLLDKCLKAVRRSGEQLDAERGRLLEVRRRSLAAALELVNAYLNQVDSEKKQLDAQVSSLTELHREIKEKTADSKTPPPPREDGRIRAEPRSEEDLNFQRDTSEELVYAWQDAVNQETRDALARVLFNAGVEPLGEPGQRVDFDGTWQHPEDELAPGDLVEVIQPGWRLVNQYGPYVIARARVRKAKQPESEKESPHARPDQR